MLIEFRVENHRSVREEQVLTMEATRLGEEDDPRVRAIDGHRSRMLTVGAIYGANASGKSNLLDAFQFMRLAVIQSHRIGDPDGGVPRHPFAWGGRAAEPSVFEVTVVVNGVRYEYGFAAEDARFCEEWLYAYPDGHKQTWLERSPESFHFGKNLRGENRLVERVTRPNALFLSAAAQHRHEQLAPLYRWFRSAKAFNVRRSARSPHVIPKSWVWEALAAHPAPRQVTLFEEDGFDPSGLQSFTNLLQAADFGIVGIKLDTEGDGGILLRHRQAAEDAWLPLSEESHGTRTLFQLGPALLDVLRNGGLLVVDELDASLHPLLAMKVVDEFNNPRTNRRNAQLLFTTHDTSLLGSSSKGETRLRRDQVWLTEKDQEGATSLTPLADFKPRKGENLERGYLQGRYGAIPFLSDLIVAEGDE